MRRINTEIASRRLAMAEAEPFSDEREGDKVGYGKAGKSQRGFTSKGN